MVYKFCDKKSERGAIKNKTVSDQRLAVELHKPINRNFLKCEVYSSFNDDIRGAALADMPLISKYNKGFRCVIDVYNNKAWGLPLKK